MIMSELIRNMSNALPQPLAGESVYFRYKCQRCSQEYNEITALPRVLADEILLMAISGEETTYDLHQCNTGVGISNVIGYDLTLQG